MRGSTCCQAIWGPRRDTRRAPLLPDRSQRQATQRHARRPLLSNPHLGRSQTTMQSLQERLVTKLSAAGVDEALVNKKPVFTNGLCQKAGQYVATHSKGSI